MTTTRQHLENKLIVNGFSETQAKAVMDEVVSKINREESYRITWDRPASEYPDAVLRGLYVVMRPIAYNWLKENKPHAWFIDMFKY